MDPCSYLTNPDEILNVNDDVWETSLEHDPRAGLTAEQIAQGRVTEVKRLSEECNVFVPRPQSEVPPHLKNISSRWEIQSCCSVGREFRLGKPRTDLFAVASSSITPRLTGKNWRSDFHVRHHLRAGHGTLRGGPAARMAGTLDQARWRPTCLLGTYQGTPGEAHGTEGLTTRALLMCS